MSFTLSPRLIFSIFLTVLEKHNAAPAEYPGWAALLSAGPQRLVRERPEAVLLLRANLLFIAAKHSNRALEAARALARSERDKIK